LCRRAFRRARQCRDTISFEKGVLKVVGDAGNNSFTVGRTPAGVITLNGAQVVGGAATVSNVSVVHLEGGAGNDTLRFDEANGPMPKGEIALRRRARRHPCRRSVPTRHPPSERGQDPHDGGLAGAVRAQQAKHGALGNGKVDPGERRRLLELLHQSFNFDGGHHASNG
jgi:hypothetical protein